LPLLNEHSGRGTLFARRRRSGEEEELDFERNGGFVGYPGCAGLDEAGTGGCREGLRYRRGVKGLWLGRGVRVRVRSRGGSGSDESGEPAPSFPHRGGGRVVADEWGTDCRSGGRRRMRSRRSKSRRKGVRSGCFIHPVAGGGGVDRGGDGATGEDGARPVVDAWSDVFRKDGGRSSEGCRRCRESGFFRYRRLGSTAERPLHSRGERGSRSVRPGL
jgi:hypothetical protein